MAPCSLFVINPIARGAPPLDVLRLASARLEAEGWQTEFVLTQRKGDAVGVAREASGSGCDVVIACGGDGTVNEVANGLAGSETALAVIRGGTANVWAKEVGIPRDPLAAVRLLKEGRRRRVDLGVVESAAGESRYFLLMAGIGVDGHVVGHVPEGLKRRFGAVAYVAYALADGARFRPQPVSLTIEGETAEVNLFWLVAGNTRSYGGLVNITHHAVVDDGLLDMYAFTGGSVARKVGLWLRVLTHQQDSAPGIEYRRVREVRLSTPSPLEGQVDGEVLGLAPQVIRVVPRALTVVVPKAKNELFGRLAGRHFSRLDGEDAGVRQGL
ncbi:MAG: diacylglycerol kinase family protein [Dehalococcoidia bacterium]